MVSHSHEDKPVGTTGEQVRPCYPGFQSRRIKLQNLCQEKSVGVVVVGKTPSLTREVIGETPGVLECTQTHLRNQHQKGPICLWVVGEVTESWLRAK